MRKLFPVLNGQWCLTSLCAGAFDIPAMKVVFRLLAACLMGAFQMLPVLADEPTVAEFRFDRRFETPAGFATVARPAWISAVGQQGGGFVDEPASWQVAASSPDGGGRLTISLNRGKLAGDLAATLLFSAEKASDIAVQLFDDQGRVVVVDLFGNLVEVGALLSTNTFIIPLARYPSATQIVLRQVHGPVTAYGMVLYPVVSEGQMVKEEMSRLARQLGDPLSPENPILQNLQNIATGTSIPTAAGSPAKAVGAAALSSGTTPAVPLLRRFDRPVSILVEDSHGGSDIRNEYNFGSAQLGRILSMQGAKVMSTRALQNFNRAAGLTRELLEPFGVVLFNGRYNGGGPAFTEAEINAVSGWVRAGGGLLVTCSSPTASDHKDASIFNPLIKPYGMQFGNVGIEGTYRPASGQPVHPVLRGLNAFYVWHGIAVESTLGEDIALVRGETVMMSMRPGKGRVMAFGAGSALQNQALSSKLVTWSPSHTISANSALLMNPALWLSGTDPAL